nr:MAG TPA: hypothetical protein [Caudoviricetes sp.]
MSFEIISSTTIRRESNLRVERMELCVDAASDLPTVNSITGCKIAQGSIAWDISTGDFYGMSSTGEWINQSGGANAVLTLELTAEDYPVAVAEESEVADDEPMGNFESTEVCVQ